MLGNGNVGIAADQPQQMLTLATPEGTRLEITRTSASLPWYKATGDLNEGAFVINQQSAGSAKPNADLGLMRDGKLRLILGNVNTILSSQEGGNLLFKVDVGEPGEQEIARFTGAGKAGIGATTPRNPLAIRAQGNSEELISFEDPAGNTKWHINQNLGGNKPGFNIAETDVADGRIFIKAGGNVGIGTTVPAEKLDVRGKIKLGSLGDLFALGALESLRVITGRVASSGNPAAGVGFDSQSISGAGRYEVTFDDPFDSEPFVLVTPSGGGSDDNAANTFDISANRFRVNIADIGSPGGPENAPFDFIALGRV